MTETEKHLTFIISNLNFSIPALCVKRIIPYQECDTIPASYSYVEGIINSNDGTITVVDPNVLFEIFDDKKKSHIIILDFEEGLLGISINGLDDMINVENNQKTYMKNLFNNNTDFIGCIINHEDTLYNCFSLKNLKTLAG